MYYVYDIAIMGMQGKSYWIAIKLLLLLTLLLTLLLLLDCYCR